MIQEEGVEKDYSIVLNLYLIRHGETTANRDGLLQGFYSSFFLYIMVFSLLEAHIYQF